jgi:predicted flap endonuclease-1-like 5' DNA nuclease
MGAAGQGDHQDKEGFMAKVTSIEGIGETFGKKLESAGIPTQKELLAKGGTPAGRKELAKGTGIGDALILKWVNRADLARIKGIGEEYADLLEAAGVDSVPELAQRRGDNLFAKINEVNAVKQLVRKLPTAAQVADWIEQAKKLPRVVCY